ncbi:hypothetical protein [Mycobacterium sp. SMC-4]|uniref:hypothetical protein n=1 Tax=Mycobacterium sp. SMC-4 TaxID=2857059 RepID=UPI0021B3C1CB|nr:hypothetical protein [Mycobacterium sp. SMC-4]UXA19293.1 hypothetical protein KXD98_06635 [Mycobacterium sp. SMC-4]
MAPAIALISNVETRLVMAKLVAGAAVGLLLGALLGGLAFSAMGSDATATAFLRLRNPADLSAIAGGAVQNTPDTSGNHTDFAAGEIAYLSGEGFAQAVGRKMAFDKPAEMTIAQASDSSIVSITATSSSEGEAIRTVQTAIDIYSDDLEQRIDQQLRLILPQLTRWQEQAADPVRVAELERIRGSVELQAADASALLVVQPPTPNYPSSQQWLIGAVLGGLLGASAVAGYLLTRRRRTGRAALLPTLTDGVDGVLVPPVNLDALGEERLRLARSLYAQLPSTQPDRQILVVGASASSGGAAVAALLEAAATDGARVVSSGVVGDTTLTPAVIAAATDIVLVARLDADTAPHALALQSATASSDAPTAALFTYRRPRLGRRRAGQHERDER